MESSKLAQLGIDPTVLANAIAAQGAMSPAGMLETTSDNVYLRLPGPFENLDELRNMPIRINNRTFRLGDIVEIKRDYADPAEPKMFFNGQPAIGIAVSMEEGGNILKLGEDLAATIARIKQDLPLGLEIHQVFNQPQVVKRSIGEFVQSLREAVIIVLLVSFLSLGIRSGVVVALCIPLVIAGTFVGMRVMGIDLHKVSLGALIISLGLLVDDAIIAIEMMTVKLEQGWDRFRAACFAYTATAFPMLTGTLITCAGFIPVGFAKGTAAEFTSSLFTVITISLLISWFVSVLITPLFGYKLVKPKQLTEHELYNTKFYRLFRRTLVWCLNHRKLVLAVTLVCFIGSIGLLKFVKQEFFPPSTRPEILVEMTLPIGASLAATEQEAKRFAGMIHGDSLIDNYSYYVGKGAPRFVLTTEPKLPATNYAQFVIVAKDLEARDTLRQKISQLLANEFPNVQHNVKLIQTGPPSAYPVMIRVTGYDHAKVRELANQVAGVMAANPNLRNINFDWYEKSKVMRLTVDQDKARMLGIYSKSLATSLQSQLSGASVAEYYEGDKTVSIVYRLDPTNRKNLADIKAMPIHVGNGKFVPLEQIAAISYDAEEGLIWRRDLKPTITVQADVVPGITGNDAAQQVYDSLQHIRENLPLGYSIDIGGSLESSKKSMHYLLQPVPAMIMIIAIILMLQLQKISLMVLALLTAPLGIIGVSLFMLLTMRPMGFVAELGIIALSGMIIRNSVILLDQIEQHKKAGESVWDSIIDSAVLRFRPIMLTAAAAILGMVPLMPSNFWGPMAVAIAGGLSVATVLPLLVLPTMYAVWFKVRPETAVHNETAGVNATPPLSQ